MKSIKYWRKQARLTQSELAALVDVSEITIRRWENTEQNPSWDDIKKLCEVLNVNESELLNGPNNQNKQRFELILDPDDKFQMEVINMTETAMEYKSMSVSPKRIGLNLNLNTSGMSKKAARELMLATFDEVFNDAWNQQMKWQKREPKA